MKVFIAVLALAMAAQANIKASGNEVTPFALKDYPLEKFLSDSANVLNQRITVDAAVRKSILDESLSLDLNAKTEKKKFKEILVSVLDSYGFTLIENNSGLILVSSRDLRYMPSPVILAEDLKEGGQTHTMAVFKTKYPVANEISRNLRPFLSRYARVISLSDARHILIHDSKKNIIALKDLIATMDTQATYEAALNNMRKEALSKKESAATRMPPELRKEIKNVEKGDK